MKNSIQRTKPSGVPRSIKALAIAGSVTGLTAGLTGGIQRFIKEPNPLPAGEWIGLLAFFLVYCAPPLLALYGLKRKKPAQPAAIWFAVAGISLMTALRSASISSAVLWVASAALLGLAGRKAYLNDLPNQGDRVFALASALVVIGALSWLMLFSNPDPVCWVLVRGNNRPDNWMQMTYRQETPSLPGDPSPGDPVKWRCESDTITPGEGLFSIGLWLFAFAGLSFYMPRWQTPLVKETRLT
jgi:hypothetical protein